MAALAGQIGRQNPVSAVWPGSGMRDTLWALEDVRLPSTDTVAEAAHPVPSLRSSLHCRPHSYQIRLLFLFDDTDSRAHPER